MGIMIEQRSSNRKGMIRSSYQGLSFGYSTYHCCKREIEIMSINVRCKSGIYNENGKKSTRLVH